MASDLARIKKEIEGLPAEELREVSRLVGKLLAQSPASVQPHEKPAAAGYGWAKGLIHVPVDFDAPLDDFREYME